MGKRGYDFAMALRAVSDGGSIRQLGEYLVVENADKVWLYITSDCTYHCKDELNRLLKENKSDNGVTGECGAVLESNIALGLLKKRIGDILDESADKGYEELFKEHVRDYRELFGRVDFSLDEDDLSLVHI